MISIKSNQSGFALLITLVVVSVVLAIGFTVLDLTIKQVRLTTNARESEVAFHAANAGLECARFWRRNESDRFEQGDPVGGIQCFGVSVGGNVTPSNLVDNGSDGYSNLYQWEHSWTADADPRCTEVTMLVASTSINAASDLETNLATAIPGYSPNPHRCEPGARCTVISVIGINQPCAGAYPDGTIQREVLLQF